MRGMVPTPHAFDRDINRLPVLQHCSGHFRFDLPLKESFFSVVVRDKFILKRVVAALLFDDIDIIQWCMCCSRLHVLDESMGPTKMSV
jgi:hypothetical protein